MRYVIISKKPKSRYTKVEDVKEVTLKHGMYEPFLKEYNKTKEIVCKDRKSGKFGVIIDYSKENGELTISRNNNQSRPNQNEDFKKVLKLAKRYGYKIDNKEYYE